MIKGKLVAAVAMMLLAGCSLFRANPLELNRGAVVLIFDTRTAGDLRSLRRTLSAYDARATVFAAGQISGGTVGALEDLQSEGHEIGLSGLRGVDPRSYSLMYGQLKYFQDEIVTQLLGGERYGISPSYFLLPRFYEAKAAELSLPAFLVSKGFVRVVQKLPDKVLPRARPAAELTKPVVSAYALTTDVFDRAQIAGLAARNEILVVMPSRQVLPALLEEASVQGVPFATLSDLRREKRGE